MMIKHLLKIHWFVLQDNSKEEKINDEIANKIDRFSEMIVEQIKNYAQVLKGNPQNCRYSPFVLKAALSHYLSNKKGMMTFKNCLYSSIPQLTH